MATAYHFIDIETNWKKVMECFLGVEGIKGWWTQDARLHSTSPKIYALNFGSEYHNKMQVEKESENFVQWRCIEGAEEWKGTSLKFNVEQVSENESILRFQHDEWREPTDFFASCNTIWGYYMESIKSYCEQGKGTPA